MRSFLSTFEENVLFSYSCVFPLKKLNHLEDRGSVEDVCVCVCVSVCVYKRERERDWERKHRVVCIISFSLIVDLAWQSARASPGWGSIKLLKGKRTLFLIPLSHDVLTLGYQINSSHFCSSKEVAISKINFKA
jgi:hypothetical protein